MKYLSNEKTAALKQAYFAGECKALATRYYNFDGENIEEIDPHESDSYYRVERDIEWNGKSFTLSISDDADIATEN